MGKNSSILEVYYLVEHELCVQIILGQQESPFSPRLSNNITRTLHCLELLSDKLKTAQVAPLSSDLSQLAFFLFQSNRYFSNGTFQTRHSPQRQWVPFSEFLPGLISTDVSVCVCAVSSSDESALQLRGSRAVHVLPTPLPPSLRGHCLCH